MKGLLCSGTARDFAIIAALLVLSTSIAHAMERPERQQESESGIVLISGDSANGIQGYISNGTTQIDFESRVADGVLRSRIRAADGRLLWQYEEGLTPTLSIMSSADFQGTRLDVPKISIAGIPFEWTYNGQVLLQMQAIANSNEGDLLRSLALKLYLKAGGGALIAERRGLETAYQAIQQSYGRLPESGQSNGQPVDGHSKQAAMQTEDYLISDAGGFVVKTQHPNAVFMNNRYFPPSKTSEQIRPYDDPHIGDDCFGMCADGCSSRLSCGYEGWSHQWIGEPTATLIDQGCACSRKVEGTPCGDAYWLMHYTFAGVAVHTIRGRSSPGCIAHDWCCRTLLFGCWNPACIAIAPLALDCFIDGWPVSWSYVGPHYELKDFRIPSPPECTCEPCPPTEY